jgi:hypothetical protein
VHGLRLADGRRVVVKVHGPRVAAPYRWAVRTVQERLAARGFPAPRPLAGPLGLGRGLAMAEERVEGGGPADAHRPDVRRVMATALAPLVKLARPFVHLSGLRRNMMEIEEGRCGRCRTTGASTWTGARSTCASANGRVTAVYDRDGLSVVREPLLVGSGRPRLHGRLDLRRRAAPAVARRRPRVRRRL